MNKMHFGLAGDPRTADLLACVDRLRPLTPGRPEPATVGVLTSQPGC